MHIFGTLRQDGHQVETRRRFSQRFGTGPEPTTIRRSDKAPGMSAYCGTRQQAKGVLNRLLSRPASFIT